MMSCTTSVAWSCPVLSLCCTEHGPYRGAVLSGHITSVAMSRSDQLGRCCTVAACTSAGASVTHERALKTCEPSCVPRVARPFFIPVVHSPPGLWDTWQHRSSPHQGGKDRSRETRGSAGGHLSKEVRSGVTGHVVAPEPTSTGRCGPKLQLTWQRVDTRHAPCLDLELVYGGNRSLGYRHYILINLYQLILCSAEYSGSSKNH
jgi:hypothetical protein